MGGCHKAQVPQPRRPDTSTGNVALESVQKNAIGTGMWTVYSVSVEGGVCWRETLIAASPPPGFAREGLLVVRT